MQLNNNISIPQLEISGGLHFFSVIMYGFCLLISIFGLYGALSGNVNGMNFYDGILMMMLGAFFALSAFFLMKFITENRYVVFYENKIELTNKKGKLIKSIKKEDILFIRAYEIVASKAPTYHQITFNQLLEKKPGINTLIIFIESKAWKINQKKPNLESKKAIFLHRNQLAVNWLVKYYSEKIE
jgi:hypothetical protein